jgi:hypothetical protein
MVWFGFMVLIATFNNISVIPVASVLRCHFWNKEKVAYKKGDLLKEVQFILKLSMTDQEKDDLLIQVTA